MYLPLYCKGSKRVTQGFTVRGSWRSNRTAIYIDPHSYGHQRCVFLVLLMLNWRPRGSAPCWMMTFFTASYHQLVSKTPSGVLRAPSAMCGFPYHILSLTSLIPNSSGPQGPPPLGFLYHILSATSLDPNSSGVPRAPSAGLSLPHLISNFSGPQLNQGPRGPLRPGVAFPTTSHLLLQLSDFLSWLSYIIVQRPLNPWNGMFDCHQAEITVMQFTGHSLPVHHSVAAQWDLHLVPYYQPSSPVRFLSINGH